MGCGGGRTACAATVDHDDEDPTMSAAAARRLAATVTSAAVVVLLAPGGPTSAVAAPGPRSLVPPSPTSAVPAAAGSAFPTLLVTDPMSRHERRGWGLSGIGGPWQVSSPATRFGVDGSEGSVVAVPGSRSAALLPAAVAADSRTLVRLVVPRLPGAGTLTVAVTTRASGLRRYEQRLVVDPRGRARLLVVRVDGRGPSTRVGRVVTLPRAVRAGQRLDVRVQTAAVSPVVLAARVWPSGTPEPQWQLVARDASPQRLRAAGALGLALSADRTGAPVIARIDGVRAVDLAGRRTSGTGAPAPVPAPVPAPAPPPPHAPTPAPPPPPGPPPAPAPPAPPVVTTSDGRPDAATTGVPDGTDLTVVEGDVVVTQPGTVLDGLDVHGFVFVRAADVVIRRSVVRGGAATGNIGLITADDPAVRNLRIEDTDLVAAVPSVWIDGIKGANFTASRVDIRGTVDAIKVYGDHVRVEASYLHNTARFADDPNQRGGPTHNDGIQVLGGHDIVIVGNDVRGASNAALQVTQDHGAVTDLVFNGNWVDGGGCSVNLANKGLPRMSGLSVVGNRFGRGMRFRGCAILGSRGTSFTADGNIWDDDGSPVPVRRDG